jgi:uncharacterized protein YjcR
MERDPKTGRFLSGNKAAVGNKGNRLPKWGNKNAVKHGFYQTFIIPSIGEDGNLYLYKKSVGYTVIPPNGFFKDEEGRIWIRDDITTKLEEMGYVF